MRPADRRRGPCPGRPGRRPALLHHRDRHDSGDGVLPGRRTAAAGPALWTSGHRRDGRRGALFPHHGAVVPAAGRLQRRHRHLPRPGKHEAVHEGVAADEHPQRDRQRLLHLCAEDGRGRRGDPHGAGPGLCRRGHHPPGPAAGKPPAAPVCCGSEAREGAAAPGPLHRPAQRHGERAVPAGDGASAEPGLHPGHSVHRRLRGSQ